MAAALLAALAGGLQAQAPPTAAAAETVRIDVTGSVKPFPHFWEEIFGSGRAILALREDYREDLRAVKAVTGLRYVRFHGILMDEEGVYDEDRDGRPVYNFTYIDQIYDGLLKDGVRPFVEISFMPEKLAARPDRHNFWYHPFVSPPKDYAPWDEFMRAFARHLISRYGIDEVATWYFEVWNEPNLRFWTGKPTQETYFELYDHTARALKDVSPRLRVGGPSTARSLWVGDFLAHTTANKVPVDFVSSHIYAMDNPKLDLGTDEKVPEEEMVYRGVKHMREELDASPAPSTPLIVSEFSGSRPESGRRDTLYMGPWLAHVISECDGLAQTMAFWPFSDVFEEHGIPHGPFGDGGRGLFAPDDVPKPSYVAFALLHKLGEERLPAAQDDVLVTRRKDGTVVVALWNMVPAGADATHAHAKEFHVALDHGFKARQATLYRLDAAHGDTRDAWERMGKPEYPSAAQVSELKRLAEAALHGEQSKLRAGALTLSVPPQGLAVIEIH